MNKTPEEERRIVRENALTQANELFRTLSKDRDTAVIDANAGVAIIIDMAKQFEAWVFEDHKETMPTVQSTKACPKCGEQIPRGFSFHAKCGHRQETQP